MSKKKSSRIRKFKQQNKTNCNFTEIKKAIAQTQKDQKGLDEAFIRNYLKCIPSFIGCYAENELENLTVHSYPCFLIVNLDSSEMTGSHWIALGVFAEKLEIFDSLGFQLLRWPRIPCSLLKFLHRMIVSRQLKIVKRIQSKNSILCGYFSIFYVVFRSSHSFREISSVFTSDLSKNDSILIKIFSYFINHSYLDGK